MLACGREDGGGVVAKCHPVMGWTGRRSARERRFTRGRMDVLRKADDGLSSGILFSSRVGVAMQQVVLCFCLVRLNGATQIHHLIRKDRTGYVEYWNAQCGETRPLRLDGGKERKLLPIRTVHVITRWRQNLIRI